MNCIGMRSVLGILGVVSLAASSPGSSSFIGPINQIDATSTVPPNGDVNPYGVAVVPATIGRLVQGNVLVSNFNNANNLQGTGRTIVQIGAFASGPNVFAHINPGQVPCPGGIGLTTALVALRSGWVIVGSLPTTDGMSDTASAGCLIVVNGSGQAVKSFSLGQINGPWDMTALDKGSRASLFVTNVLNGTVKAGGQIVTGGTVLRIDIEIPQGGAPPIETARTIIGSGFPERTDPAALVIGPTGVGLAADGTLYVNDTLGNRIVAIANAATRTTDAGTGVTVSGGGALNGALGLVIAPNGNILTVNSNDGNMVETTPAGDQIAVKNVDTTGTGAGTLFGLAIQPGRQGVYFVNDGNNTLDLLH